MTKPVNCSVRFCKCRILFSCDTAQAVCSVGRQAVFDATKADVTFLQHEGAIQKLDDVKCILKTVCGNYL